MSLLVLPIIVYLLVSIDYWRTITSIYIYIFLFIFVIRNWSGYTFVSLLYIVVSNIDDGKSGSMMV